MTIEPTSADAMDDVEADTARWRVFLEENWDDLVKGVPKRPEGWWQQDPGEDAIAYIFRMFPLVRPN